MGIGGAGYQCYEGEMGKSVNWGWGLSAIQRERKERQITYRCWKGQRDSLFYVYLKLHNIKVYKYNMYFNDFVLLGVRMLPTKSDRVTQLTTRDEKLHTDWW